MDVHAGCIGDFNASLIVADISRRGRRGPDAYLLVRVLADVGQPEDILTRRHVASEAQFQRGVVVEINEILRCQCLPGDGLFIVPCPAEQFQPERAFVVIVARRRHVHIVKGNRGAELDGVIGMYLHRRIAVRLAERDRAPRHGHCHALRGNLERVQVGPGGIRHKRKRVLPGGQLHGARRAVQPRAPVDARNRIGQRLRNLLSVQKQAEHPVCGILCPAADHAPLVGLLYPHLQVDAVARADTVKIGFAQRCFHVQLPGAAVDMSEGLAGVGKHDGGQCGRTDCCGFRRGDAKRHRAAEKDCRQQECQRPGDEIPLKFHSVFLSRAGGARSSDCWFHYIMRSVGLSISV